MQKWEILKYVYPQSCKYPNFLSLNGQLTDDRYSQELWNSEIL